MAGNVDWISFTYAALLAAGGIVGFATKGSAPSLVAGVTTGCLMAVGAYQTSNDPKNVLLSLVTSAALTGVMGYRFYMSGKFMPAGLVAVVSLGMVARFGIQMYLE